jgi:ribose 5-phosphate isomerase B
MVIVMGADHAGYHLKQTLLARLASQNILTLDVGTVSDQSVDYPDYAHRVCNLLERGQEYGCVGVLVCGTGQGMAMAANKHRHIRCAVSTTPAMAWLARAHNNANVLALGARLVDEATAWAILDAFLTTGYEGGRHEQRVRKLNPA